MKIKLKLLLVFSIMVFLSVATVGLNLMTYKSLDSDAVFVNYAGKLRANSYRMAYLSERIIIGGVDQPAESKLENQFKPAYEAIAKNGDRQGLSSMEGSVDGFVSEVDQFVGGYSALSQSKVANAKVISDLMLLITVLFGIFGVIMETTYADATEIESINLTVKNNFGTITESASKISEVVTNNSSNTQNVAAAVQEQTASFEEVSANMNALNELSIQFSSNKGGS